MDNSSFKNRNHLLLLISSESTPVTTVKLRESIYSVGRNENNSIQLVSSSVSRHHATLMRKELTMGESVYILVDGDLEGRRSQNGTWVNGNKIIHHTLSNGDVITFGSDENKAIYKQEFVTNYYYPYCDIGTKQVIDAGDKSDKLSREKLQDTLIISELNLQDNLENQNIQRLASFPELSPSPILEFDFNGRITYFNPSAKFSFSEFLDQHPQDNPLIKGLNLSDQKYHGELLIREVEVNNKHYEQYIHYLSQEEVIRSYMFDITERKNSEAKLKYQAFHDSLTGIPNRDFFYWQLGKQIQEAEKNTKQNFAVLFIDIDRFKNVNDTLSHSVGDTLLEYFAYRLISSIPTDYFMARWGGDEFILITPLSLESNKAEEVAEMIINCLKQPFLIHKHRIYISCSIGISVYPDDGKNDKNLVKNADIALYRAKQIGRNNYQFYTTKLSREKRLLFELENSLYHCLEKDELFLTFQPQLSLKTNKILSVEVLLRWKHPVLGVISPNKFIPLAEETGLIIPIGEWVLEKACIQAKKWVSLGNNPLMIAVNVSAKQFQTNNFAARVKRILKKTRFNPKFLELEITETILMQDHEKTEKIINDLTALGVKFSLDDFGTGYSSLSYLKKFPFHQVKIDKSFIKDLAFNPQDHALVSAVITLARGYDMIVVAEGVETESQKILLQTLKCDLIQGWLVSMPLTETEFIDFLYQYKSSVL